VAACEHGSPRPWIRQILCPAAQYCGAVSVSRPADCRAEGRAFVWVPVPILAESFAVISAWGFTYQTLLVWNKIHPTFDYLHDAEPDLLLVCPRRSRTLGRPLVEAGVQPLPRASAGIKPDDFRRLIDRLYPEGRRLELFSRQPTDRWDVWGNKVTG